MFIWKVESGEKLRQIEWNQFCSQRLGPLSIASFHTLNNNRILYGGMVLNSLNISTGQSAHLLGKKFSSDFCSYNKFFLDFKMKVTSVAFATSGSIFVASDENGGLSLFRTDSNLSRVSKIRRFLISPNKKISNISLISQTASSFSGNSFNDSLFDLQVNFQSDLEIF